VLIWHFVQHKCAMKTSWIEPETLKSAIVVLPHGRWMHSAFHCGRPGLLPGEVCVMIVSEQNGSWADPRWPRVLRRGCRQLACCDFVFESRRGRGCLLLLYVCRQVKSPRQADLSSRGVISSVYASLTVIRCNNPLHFQWVKVKWSRYRPGVAQRVGRGIVLLFHGRGTRREWVVNITPRPHFTPAKDPVPILQETGSVWTGGKSRPHRDSIPDRPARSHSLYRLSYLAHHFQWVGRRIPSKKRERKKERRKERKKERRKERKKERRKERTKERKKEGARERERNK